MRCRHGRRLRCLRTRALLLPSVHSTANPICLLQVSDRIPGVGERIALAAHSAGRGSPRRAVGHLSGSWRRPAAQSGSLAGTVACAGDPHAFAGPSLVRAGVCWADSSPPAESGCDMSLHAWAYIIWRTWAGALRGSGWLSSVGVARLAAEKRHRTRNLSELAIHKCRRSFDERGRLSFTRCDMISRLPV